MKPCRNSLLCYLAKKGPEWKDRLYSEIAAARAELALEVPNVLASLEFATTSPERANVGLGLATSVNRYWQLVGNTAFFVRYFDRLFASSPTDAHIVAYALWSVAILHFYAGQEATSVDCYERAIAAFMELGDPKQAMNLKVNLATVRASSGDMAAAEEICSEILSSKVELDVRTSVSSLYSQVTYKKGDYEASLQMARNAADGFASLNNHHGLALSINNVGHALRRLGRYEEARAAYSESLRMRKEIGDRIGVVLVMEGCSKLCAVLGHEEEGIKLATLTDSFRTRLRANRLSFDTDEWVETLETLRNRAGDRFEDWRREATDMDEATAVAFLEETLSGLKLLFQVGR